MSHLTVAQCAEILIKIVGACFLIVVVSFPIQSFANYLQGETAKRRQIAVAEDVAPKQTSWVPSKLSALFSHPAPQNSLVPPPPPLAY